MIALQKLLYTDGDVALTGLLARPEGPARAAIVVYPTIANPTPAVTDKAQALAEAGYLALIADFYGAQPAGMEQARELATALRSSQEAYRRRLRLPLEALSGLDEAQGIPTAAIGFCMGGQAALELARDGAAIAAAVSFHGLLATSQPAEPGKVKARILVCHGDRDPLVPREQVLAFWEEMDAAAVDWHFHSYSGVRHGFTNPYPVPENPALAYNASADRQSWAAMHSLFDELFPD